MDDLKQRYIPIKLLWKLAFSDIDYWFYIDINKNDSVWSYFILQMYEQNIDEKFAELKEESFSVLDWNRTHKLQSDTQDLIKSLEQFYRSSSKANKQCSITNFMYDAVINLPEFS